MRSALKVVRVLCLFCAITTAGRAHAQSELDGFELSFPESVAANQVVEAGQEGDFAFSVHNAASTSGSAAVTGAYVLNASVLSGYLFTATDPVRCAVPVLDATFDPIKMVFIAGPLGAGETLNCSYRIRRAAGSIDDLEFRSCGPRWVDQYCSHRFRRGSLPDLELAAEPLSDVPAGATEALVRLRLINHSSHDVASRVASTDCREFAGGLFDHAPFTVDTAFVGACAADRGASCLNFLGQNFDSYGFRLGPVTAGGSSSCLVRLHLRAPASMPVSTELFLLDDRVRLSNGGLAYDVNSANEHTLLGISVASAVPISIAAMALVVLGLGLFGVQALSSRARR